MRDAGRVRELILLLSGLLDAAACAPSRALDRLREAGAEAISDALSVGRASPWAAGGRSRCRTLAASVAENAPGPRVLCSPCRAVVGRPGIFVLNFQRVAGTRRRPQGDSLPPRPPAFRGVPPGQLGTRLSRELPSQEVLCLRSTGR